MAKFDVHRSADGTYLVDCQSDVLRHLNTRLVIPLSPATETAQVERRLNPVLGVDGTPMMLMTHLAAAVLTNELKSRVTTLVEHDLTISAALDMLISGY